jgi:hypothetical protein
MKRKPSAIGRLAKLGYDKEKLQVMSNKEFTLKIAKHFSDNLPPKDITSDINEMQDALNMLKNVRDKAIAHSEAIEILGLKPPSYIKIDRLVDQAKMFVIIVGSGYLGLNYELDGRYLHSSDAKRASRSLRRLLIKAEILKDV